MKLGIPFAITIMLSISLTATPALAEIFTGSGKVATIRSHHSGIHNDWFSIEGFNSTNAGSCLNSTDNNLLAIMIEDSDRGKRHFSLISSAYLSGLPITVVVNDSMKDAGGYCKLFHVSLGQ